MDLANTAFSCKVLIFYERAYLYLWLWFFGFQSRQKGITCYFVFHQGFHALILFPSFNSGDVSHHIFEQIGAGLVAIEATVIAVSVGKFLGRQQFPFHCLLHFFHQIAPGFSLLQLGQSFGADAKE